MCLTFRKTGDTSDRTGTAIPMVVGGTPPTRSCVSIITIIYKESIGTYRGDSGMKRIPIPKMVDQIRPIPTTRRQEIPSGRWRVPMEMA